MNLSKIGIIANILWYEIKNHQQNISLGEFVIMPNHIHGILTIDKPFDNWDIYSVGSLHATTQQDKIATTQQDKIATTQQDKIATTQQDKIATTQQNRIATTQQDKIATTQQDKIATTQQDKIATAQQDKTASTQTTTIQQVKITTTNKNEINQNIDFDSPEWYSHISPRKGSISTIIRSYKSAVSKHAHRLGFEFQWQPKFYDHIIRNKKEIYKIINYIKNNPKNYRKDKFSAEF